MKEALPVGLAGNPAVRLTLAGNPPTTHRQ
jgi:hypothetical protein